MSQGFEMVLEATEEEYAERVSKMEDRQLINEYRNSIFSSKTRNYVWEDAYNQAAQIVETELLKRLGNQS